MSALDDPKARDYASAYDRLVALRDAAGFPLPRHPGARNRARFVAASVGGRDVLIYEPAPGVEVDA